MIKSVPSVSNLLTQTEQHSKHLEQTSATLDNHQTSTPSATGKSHHIFQGQEGHYFFLYFSNTSRISIFIGSRISIFIGINHNLKSGYFKFTLFIWLFRVLAWFKVLTRYRYSFYSNSIEFVKLKIITLTFHKILFEMEICTLASCSFQEGNTTSH